jgi:hypothetical protein
VLELGARRLPVEMRGEQIDGFLSDGDRVEVPAESVADRTARPHRVENLTTDTPVVVRLPGRLRRYSRLVGAGEIAAALISASLTSGAGFAVAEVRGSSPAGPVTSTAQVAAGERDARGVGPAVPREEPAPGAGLAPTIKKKPASGAPGRSRARPTAAPATKGGEPAPAHGAVTAAVAALAAAVAVALALLLVFVRRRRAPWRRIASTAAGVALGLAVVALVIRP